MQKITRMAALFLVAVAVVLAIVAFGIGHRAKNTAVPVAIAPAAGIGPAAAPAQRQGVPVVVAATALTAGTPISASALALAQWTQRPAGSFADTGAVAGNVLLVDVPAGTPLTAKLLSSGVAMALKPGERAMAVPVDEQAGAGNRVLPGDYVDVFLSLKTTQAAGYGKEPVDQTQTRLLLSRLRVLAYGTKDLPAKPGTGPTSDANKAAADKDAASSSSRSQDESRSVAHTAVLAVPVEDADRLLLGVQNGKLALAVRYPDDKGQPDHGLFSQPRPVLSPRVDLSAEQKQLLDTPENYAYAGINGAGLAGGDHVTPKPSRSRHATAWSSGVEIIRGSSADTPRNRTNRL